MGCGASTPSRDDDEQTIQKAVPPMAMDGSSSGGMAAEPAAEPPGGPERRPTVFRIKKAEAAAASARASVGDALAEQETGSSSSDSKPMAKLATMDVETLTSFFKKADKEGNGSLSKDELTTLLEDFLGPDIRTALDKNTGLPVLDSLLDALDADGSGDVDLDELLVAWRAWFGQCMNPVRCLLIIDVQNDFIDGSLSIKACPAGQDPSLVVPVINHMRKTLAWDTVAVSLDWHPQDHCSFAECFADAANFPVPLHSTQDAAAAVGSPPFSQLTLLSPDGETPMRQVMWPRHCVQGTWGSECHKDLVRDDNDVIVYKGTDVAVDSYSAFYDNQKLNKTSLLDSLRGRGVTHLFVTGLALDVCVAFSALHAAEEGFVVTVVVDACAGVSDEGIAEKKAAFEKAGINVAYSSELPAIFAKSSLDELTGAALRVRKAKELCGEFAFNASHGAPSS